MWDISELYRVTELLEQQISKPYLRGFADSQGHWVVKGKPALDEKNPKGFDCSGLTRWIIGQGHDPYGRVITLPHGSYNQIKVCEPVTGHWRPLHLGFASMKERGGPIDHCIIRLNGKIVIEARGRQEGKDYGKVILRPVAAWEKWKGFYGWFTPPGIHD